jgi:hypothetical protein
MIVMININDSNQTNHSKSIKQWQESFPWQKDCPIEQDL